MQAYHDELIQQSLVSEIPTVLGNVLGSGLGLPLTLVLLPIGYGAFSADSPSPTELSPRSRFTLAPMMASSVSLGMIVGTPFYPLGLAFPHRPQETPPQETTALSNRS